MRTALLGWALLLFWLVSSWTTPLLAQNQEPSHRSASTGSGAPVAPSVTASRHPSGDEALHAALPEAARSEYESGMMLAEDGDYRGALLKFQLAYNQSKDPRLLWNLAVCEKALRHYANALPLVRRYLREAGSSISPAEREEAEDLAKAIAEFVGPVRIESSQAGATVFIDDGVVGTTPLKEPVVVDMGDRKITLVKRGFKDATTEVRVLGPRPEQRVFLRMERDIPAATLEVVAGSGQWISVDDGMVGRDRWEGLVSQGKHVIKVTGTGYKPKEVEADLSNGGHVSIWVVAQPVEPAERTNRWPLVALLGGATVVVAVVAYYGLRSSESRAPTQVPGKLDEFPVGFVAKGWP